MDGLSTMGEWNESIHPFLWMNQMKEHVLSGTALVLSIVALCFSISGQKSTSPSTEEQLKQTEERVTFFADSLSEARQASLTRDVALSKRIGQLEETAGLKPPIE
jgi:hypothetical protein